MSLSSSFNVVLQECGSCATCGHCGVVSQEQKNDNEHGVALVLAEHGANVGIFSVYNFLKYYCVCVKCKLE